MDIIESILTFDKTYQFVEVGAGYGRWASRAFRLASLFCIPQEKISICTVEADPLHSQWLLEHMVLNKIPLENIHHFECAVSNFVGKSDFFIMRPNMKEHASEARNWYGQALKNSEWENASSIEVTVSKLSNILHSLPYETIDLINFDIQGEEPKVLSEIESELYRIKRIHIGTNSQDDEKFIRKFFKKIRWKKIRDYEGRGSRRTYIGKINFVDGVQTYINPTFQKS
jgi:FkbM family methyltransferase